MKTTKDKLIEEINPDDEYLLGCQGLPVINTPANASEYVRGYFQAERDVYDTLQDGVFLDAEEAVVKLEKCDRCCGVPGRYQGRDYDGSTFDIECKYCRGIGFLIKEIIRQGK